ncbi:hypothetical protein BS50DRAFT_632835 [Corynespora cassiicola Philippines]|uniref:Uncharacterized protein n=1 Tax=Corynespora cassiicola Philippines TaxID=1448308 RepID=A0A2T2NU97_CORCC|nr:hypothetical protein BS50DRAFT_632835 [Corynespora cassiicola Philippines]
MKFLALITLSASLASAADICRTSGAGCTGTKFCCSGIQEGVCCTSTTGSTERLWTLPDNSRFQVWSGQSCTGNTGVFKNPTKVTNKCIKFSWPVYSAKWLAGGGTKRSESDSDECAEPNVAIYTLDGVDHKVKIPAGNASVVEDWVEKGEWKLLAELESAE